MAHLSDLSYLSWSNQIGLPLLLVHFLVLNNVDILIVRVFEGVEVDGLDWLEVNRGAEPRELLSRATLPSHALWSSMLNCLRAVNVVGLWWSEGGSILSDLFLQAIHSNQVCLLGDV